MGPGGSSATSTGSAQVGTPHEPGSSLPRLRAPAGRRRVHGAGARTPVGPDEPGGTIHRTSPGSGGYFDRGDDGRWAEPRIAPFSGRYADQEPYISPDGDRLYFTSDRPSTGTEPIEGREAWVVELIDGGWSEPRRLEAPVRVPRSAAAAAEPGRFWGQARGPSEGPDGALYFWAERPDSRGETHLYRAPPGSRPGVFGEPQNLGPPVNTGHFETAGVLSSDGRTLVFGRDDPEGLGLGDLFVSRRTGDGWSEPRNLGAPIDSSAFDFAPRFSPDGRRLYFSSNRSEDQEGAGMQNIYYVEWPAELQSPPSRTDCTDTDPTRTIEGVRALYLEAFNTGRIDDMARLGLLGHWNEEHIADGSTPFEESMRVGSIQAGFTVGLP